jgi:hypothetical protein
VGAEVRDKERKKDGEKGEDKEEIVRYHSGRPMNLNACILILAHMVYL